MRIPARIALAAGLSLLFALPASAQQERVIRFGHLNNADHPVSFGVKRFGEILATKSGGKMKVMEFPASQLGNEMQQQSALQGGVQQMSAPATTSLAGIVKEFGLVDFPFAVANYAQADALLDGPLGQALIAKLPEKGLVALGYWDLGFRNVTNSKRAITKPEDFDGLKLRVIPNPVFIDAFKALHSNPTPLAYGELYGALESRAVDGQENPYVLISTSKFYEVQKFATHTNHVYSPLIVLAGKPFWDKLSEGERQIIQAAFREARAYQRDLSRQATTAAIADLTAKGMKINEVSPAELLRMEAAVRPTKEKFAASYDQVTTRNFFAEVEKVRNK